MFFEGNSEVFRNLFRKKWLLEQNDSLHTSIRPALLGLAGPMPGVYGAGQGEALEKFGLNSVFDTVVGVSASMANLSYFLARQSALGTAIYCEECTTPRFMRIIRLKMDADYLALTMRGEEGNKALDQLSVEQSRSKLYAAVTCAETGKGILLNAKKVEPDVVRAIRASLAIPYFTGEPVQVGNLRCLDGMGGCPFPAQKVIEKFKPTDLLVLANSPEPSTQTGVTPKGFGALVKGCPRPVVQAFANCSARFLEELQWLRTQQQCRVAILWSGDLGLFEQNPEKLREAASQAYLHLWQILHTAKDSISQ